jgi:hypothetical protein
MTMPDPYNLSEQMHARMELSRRIGFAKGQIREAMGYIDGRLPDLNGNSHLYWAYKALGCALEELDRPICHTPIVPCVPETCELEAQS